MALFYSQTRRHVIIRDYLMAFWLSPNYQPETSLSARELSLSADNGGGLIRRAITKTPFFNLFITYSILLFQRVWH